MRGNRRGLEIATLGRAAARAQPTRPCHPRRSADGHHPMGEPGRRAWADAAPQIRLGLMGGENEADRLARFDGLRRLPETTFQVPVRMIHASDCAGVVQALSARQIEFAGLGPSIHAVAWLDTNGGVAPILTVEQIDGSTSYVAIMMTRAEAAARRCRS